MNKNIERVRKHLYDGESININDTNIDMWLIIATFFKPSRYGLMTIPDIELRLEKDLHKPLTVEQKEIIPYIISFMDYIWDLSELLPVGIDINGNEIKKLKANLTHYRIEPKIAYQEGTPETKFNEEGEELFEVVTSEGIKYLTAKKLYK